MIEEFRQMVERRHDYAREWKKRTAKKIFGYFCSYVPEPLIYAADILPVRIIGSGESTLDAEKYVHPMWCSFCRDCFAQGLRGNYDYLDGIINTCGCQHMRQAYNSWIKNIPLEYFYEILMPSINLHLDSSKKHFYWRINKFKSSLEQWRGIPWISSLALDNAIEIYNTNTDLLNRLYELRKAPNPPVTGTEALWVVLASMVMDKNEHNKMLINLLKKLPGRQIQHSAEPRIMLTGSPVYDPKILEFIESLGCVIVIDESCTGSRYFKESIPHQPDHISAITGRYINRLPCPHHDLGSPENPKRQRPDYIVQMAKEYSVDGVIFMLRKFCDCHGFDFPAIRDALKDSGIPVLQLDLDLEMPLGQLRTRFEAFLETSINFI